MGVLVRACAFQETDGVTFCYKKRRRAAALGAEARLRVGALKWAYCALIWGFCRLNALNLRLFSVIETGAP